MTVEWTDAYDRKLLGLRERGPEGGMLSRKLSFSEVATLMNRKFDTSSFTKDNCQKRYNLLTPPPSLKDFPASVPTPYLDRYFDEHGKLRGRAPDKMDWRGYVAGKRDLTTLVLSDLQGVHCEDRLVERALQTYPDADLVVLPGDVCDWEAASKYVKDRDYPLAHEADWYVRLLETLTSRYPGVPIIITDSNHSRRVQNAVRQLPPELLFLTEPNAERYLAQPFPTVIVLDEWWVQIGDIIYCHPEGPTNIAGRNAVAAIEAFEIKKSTRREGVVEFSVVVVGHSHRVGDIYHNGKKGIEPGTLAKLPMVYAKTAKSLKAVQENGFGVCVQRDGVAQLNQCRSYILR